MTEADLEVLKDGNFEAGNPSTEIIYTITVTNDGPSDAQNVVVVDTLPLSGTKRQEEGGVPVRDVERRLHARSGHERGHV